MRDREWSASAIVMCILTVNTGYIACSASYHNDVHTAATAPCNGVACDLGYAPRTDSSSGQCYCKGITHQDTDFLAPSPCFKAQATILQNGTHDSQVMPQCTSDGWYESRQCDVMRDVCWCVNATNGHALVNSATRGAINCDERLHHNTGQDYNSVISSCPGSTHAPRNCTYESCMVTICMSDPDALCMVDPCGHDETGAVCGAKFYNRVTGEPVDCDKGINPCQSASLSALSTLDIDLRLVDLNHMVLNAGFSLADASHVMDYTGSIKRIQRLIVYQRLALEALRLRESQQYYTAIDPSHCYEPVDTAQCTHNDTAADATDMLWFYDAVADSCQSVSALCLADASNRFATKLLCQRVCRGLVVGLKFPDCSAASEVEEDIQQSSNGSRICQSSCNVHNLTNHRRVSLINLHQATPLVCTAVHTNEGCTISIVDRYGDEVTATELANKTNVMHENEAKSATTASHQIPMSPGSTSRHPSCPPPPPYPSYHDGGLCVRLCDRDVDCPVHMMCCGNGCGATCRIPSTADVDIGDRTGQFTCTTHRHHAVHTYIHTPNTTLYIPTCVGHEYSSLQTLPTIGYSFCVNKVTGQLISGSLQRGLANCSHHNAVPPVQQRDTSQICPDDTPLHACPRSLCDTPLMHHRATTAPGPSGCPGVSGAVCMTHPCGGCHVSYYHPTTLQQLTPQQCWHGESHCSRKQYEAEQKKLLADYDSTQQHVLSVIVEHMHEYVGGHGSRQPPHGSRQQPHGSRQQPHGSNAAQINAADYCPDWTDLDNLNMTQILTHILDPLWNPAAHVGSQLPSQCQFSSPLFRSTTHALPPRSPTPCAPQGAESVGWEHIFLMKHHSQQDFNPFAQPPSHLVPGAADEGGLSSWFLPPPAEMPPWDSMPSEGAMTPNESSLEHADIGQGLESNPEVSGHGMPFVPTDDDDDYTDILDYMGDNYGPWVFEDPSAAADDVVLDNDDDGGGMSALGIRDSGTSIDNSESQHQVPHPHHSSMHPHTPVGVDVGAPPSVAVVHTTYTPTLQCTPTTHTLQVSDVWGAVDLVLSAYHTRVHALLQDSTERSASSAYHYEPNAVRLHGSVIPQCLSNKEAHFTHLGYNYTHPGYTPTQCWGGLCWCVYPNGAPLPHTITRMDTHSLGMIPALECSAHSLLVPSSVEYSPVLCPDGSVAEICDTSCRDAQPCRSTADTSDGGRHRCVADACNHCEVTWIDAAGNPVDCSTESEHSEHQTDDAGSPHLCLSPSHPHAQLCIPEDLCSQPVCINFPEAVCVVDYCTCTARYINPHNQLTVNCTHEFYGLCERAQAVYSWTISEVQLAMLQFEVNTQLDTAMNVHRLDTKVEHSGLPINLGTGEHGYRIAQLQPQCDLRGHYLPEQQHNRRGEQQGRHRCVNYRGQHVHRRQQQTARSDSSSDSGQACEKRVAHEIHYTMRYDVTSHVMRGDDDNSVDDDDVTHVPRHVIHAHILQHIHTHVRETHIHVYNLQIHQNSTVTLSLTPSSNEDLAAKMDLLPVIFKYKPLDIRHERLTLQMRDCRITNVSYADDIVPKVQQNTGTTKPLLTTDELIFMAVIFGGLLSAVVMLFVIVKLYKWRQSQYIKIHTMSIAI